MRKIPIYLKSGNEPMTIGIFLSGSGTNFDAIVEYMESIKIKNVIIKFVFTNVPDCPGIQKADAYGFKTFSLSSKKYFAHIGKPPDDEESRILYDSEIINMLTENIETDIIVLAGYRRKFSRLFYDTFYSRIINMYPGDISKEYLVNGIPASLQALRHHDKEIRCTVYIDRENSRFGNAIIQSKPVSLDGYREDNVDELDREIREKAEWNALPHVIFEILARERLSVDKNGRLYLDEKIIPKNGILL